MVRGRGTGIAGLGAVLALLAGCSSGRDTAPVHLPAGESVTVITVAGREPIVGSHQLHGYVSGRSGAYRVRGGSAHRVASSAGAVSAISAAGPDLIAIGVEAAGRIPGSVQVLDHGRRRTLVTLGKGEEVSGVALQPRGHVLYASVVPPDEADQDAYLGRVDVRRHRIRPVVAVDLEGLEVRVVDFLDRSSLLLWLHNPYGDSDPRSDSYLAAFDLRTQAVHRITPDGQLVASGSAVAGEEYVVYDEIGRGGSHRFLRWASLDGTRSGVLRQGAWADPHVTGGGRVVAYRETGQPGQTDALGFLELSDAPWLG